MILEDFGPGGKARGGGGDVQGFSIRHDIHSMIGQSNRGIDRLKAGKKNALNLHYEGHDERTERPIHMTAAI